MSVCTCKISRTPAGNHRHSRLSYKFGPHHEVKCAMWEDPTKVPRHAQRLFDEAQTDTDWKRAILNEDLLNERD